MNNKTFIVNVKLWPRTSRFTQPLAIFSPLTNTNISHATFISKFHQIEMTSSSKPSSEASAASASSSESPVSPSELAAAARAFSTLPGPPNRFVDVGEFDVN